MRSVMFVFLILVLAMGIAMAGGIVTNTNQSAAYMRTLNRNASTDVDAVYFNPAGLTRLEDGLHLSLSNQSIFQTKTVINDYQYLSNNEFVGDVVAPFFPNFYLAYKTGKIAISAGFEIIGGGGSALYEDGLPSFEIPVSGLKPQLSVEDYRFDTEFDGKSFYLGGQAGISYKLNDMISVAVGGRYVMAKNTYVGHLKEIEILSSAGWLPPGLYLTGVATTLSNTAADLQPIIDGGAGSMTLAQLQGAGQLSAEEVALLEGGLTQLGIDPSGLTAAQVQGAYTTAAASTSAQVPYVEAATADVEVDAIQTGSGITPIFSAFITPFEGLDIALRYEMQTKLELVNDTKVDGSGLFPDGGKTNADMPAMFALGVSYQASSKLRTEFNLNYYMNTGVDWDWATRDTTVGTKAEDFLENGYEIGFAVEYCLNEKMKASVGFLNANGGATDDYQTDLSYSLKSNTIALGVAYKVSDNMTVNVGGLNTFFQDSERAKTTYSEKYAKTTFGFAFGIDYKF